MSHMKMRKSNKDCERLPALVVFVNCTIASEKTKRRLNQN